MEQVAGTYEGEGSNTTAGIASPPDVNAAIPGGTNQPESPQAVADTAKKALGKTSGVAITRRRQLRVSSESARDAVAVNVGGGDQVLGNASRGVFCTGSGNLVVRFVDGSADVTLPLSSNTVYPFAIAIVRQTGTTATGFLLM